MPNHYDITTITVRPNTHPKALPVLKDQLDLYRRDGLGNRNPVVVIPNAGGGVYDIWVGTFGSSTAQPSDV